MANPEHLEILKQGVEVWNKWREQNPRIHPDLSLIALYVDNVIDMRAAALEQVIMSGREYRGVSLDQFNLSRTDLSGSFLRGADFNRANLAKAKLWGANISEVSIVDSNLTMADLIGVDITHAYLKGTKLNETKLMQVNFTNSSIIETDFSGSEMFMTVFGNNDLRSSIGLDKVKHIGPSVIDILTLSRSKGLIPEIFLRGCGVPENFIQYMSSLTGKAFEYNSCFISHSSKDQDFAERLYTDLQNKGVRCWFAPEHMKGGKKTHMQLDEAIKLHEKLLLVISENSMNSDWVANEIKRARKHEKESGGQKLFPIRLIDFDLLKEWELFDSDTATDLAAEVRSYFIPDFSQWKNHDSYQNAFDRLIRDLKADEPTGND